MIHRDRSGLLGPAATFQDCGHLLQVLFYDSPNACDSVSEIADSPQTRASAFRLGEELKCPVGAQRHRKTRCLQPLSPALLAGFGGGDCLLARLDCFPQMLFCLLELSLGRGQLCLRPVSLVGLPLLLFDLCVKSPDLCGTWNPRQAKTR